MVGHNLLTEKKCKSAKAKGKVFYLSDGGGLRLRCRPDGSKNWLFRFSISGKEKTLGLGSYPQTSLKKARENAAAQRALMADGKNPAIERKAERSRQAAAQAHTFECIASDWLQHNKSHWSSTHYTRNTGLLRRHLLPAIGSIPLEEIEERHLFQCLQPIYDSGRCESARRSRAVAGQIFSFGRATQRCSGNPARNMADSPYFKKTPVKHFTALPQHDVPHLIEALSKTGPNQKLKTTTVTALTLMLYTGLRDHALRGATWAEINLADAHWTIPPHRMKSRTKHTVPLPHQAVIALEALRPHTFRGPDSFVFRANSKTGYMAENTLRLALHRIGFNVTVHGLRSLLTDVLSEKGFNRDAIERQLDHQERNEVRRAYLRTDFMEERVHMMQWYADWCDGKHAEKETENVINFRS